MGPDSKRRRQALPFQPLNDADISLIGCQNGKEAAIPEVQCGVNQQRNKKLRWRRQCQPGIKGATSCCTTRKENMSKIDRQFGVCACFHFYSGFRSDSMICSMKEQLTLVSAQMLNHDLRNSHPAVAVQHRSVP
jgi:hypothetical protein